MVLFHCLARLCASGAESRPVVGKPPALQEYAFRVLEPTGQEANDLAVAALHRVLSGLTGSYFQRVHGLLEALRSGEVAGATLVALYAVPDGKDMVNVEPSPVLVASTNGLDDVFGSSQEVGACRLFPDSQQYVLFRKMAHEKAAVYDCVDRSAATLSGASGAAPLEGGNSSRKRNVGASNIGSPNIGAPKLTRVAAVPLLHGSKICGALWLEQDLPLETGPVHSGPILSASSSATATSPAPSPDQGTHPAAPHPASSMLSEPRALQAFGFACSMCMLGAEGSHVGWVAGALARLGRSDSLSALTAQLCAAVAAHVLRRFVLEGQVIAALVPPGADTAPQALLLLPQPAANGPGPANNNASADVAPSGESLGLAAAVTAIPAGVAAGGGGGPPLAPQLSFYSNCGGSSRALIGRSPGGGNILQFAQQHLQHQSHLQHHHPHLEGGGPVGGSPLSAGAMASRRKLRMAGCQPWANGVMAGMVRDQHPELDLRLSLDLTSFRLRAGAAAHVDIVRSPSMGLPASSRSIVIPLCNPDGQTSAATACGGTTPALHARAFPLQRSLLLAHLTALQQRKPQSFPQLSLPVGPQLPSQLSQPNQLKHQPQSQYPPGQEAGGKRQALGPGMCGGGGGTSASSGEGSVSATAVVEDTQLHVQNVHKPSSDVCMIMGLRRTTTGMAGPGGAFSGHHSMSNVSTVNGTGGGGGGVLGSAVQAAALPQSLVLLVLSLGEGATLGLYVCFPRRLPGQLLEAVRASCQELVDKALQPLFRAKLRDRAIMPEYETLCNAGPGSYAVVRSPSLSGTQLNPLTPTLPMVLAPQSAADTTNSDLGVMASEVVATTATHHQPDLLSGLLSSADMDVMLGTQGQGHGQEGAARQDGMAGIKRSIQCFARRSAAPFVTITTTPGGGGSTMFRGSASNIARLALSLTNRSIGGERRRGAATVTGSVNAPVGPVAACVSPSPSPSPCPIAAGPGGECVEPLCLSQLLHSNNNDLTTTSTQQQLLRVLRLQGGGGQHSGSCRSLAMGLEQTGFTASIITVAGVDAAATARQQLDLLVSSIHATINTDPTAGAGNACALDDLDALELGDVLGQGGGGTVFRGKLGTLDVAVKLMELPSVDPSAAGAAQQQQQGAKPPGPPAAQAPPAGVGMKGDAAAGATTAGDASAATERLCLNARREILRNATELAVQSRVSHPNIVQIYATYNDVFMVPNRGQPGCPGSTYRLRPAAAMMSPGNGTGGRERTSNGDANRQAACVAAAFELCDGGSLGSVLAARNFPRPAARPSAASGGSNRIRGAIDLVDMKGVYMTLLDVALALRHLHSLNLVHRDIKPANLLLKLNPRDYRGFTVKLADFGFVLHLAETADDGTRFSVADQACGTVTHMAPEALLGKAKIDASVDVYAFGILMWEIFAGGVRPFPRLQPDKIPRAVYRGARPSFADDIPSTYRSLAAACWSADPNRRPKASDLVIMLNGLLQEVEG